MLRGTASLALYGDPTLTSQRLGHMENSRTLFDYYKATVKPSDGKKYFEINAKVSLEQLRQKEIDQAIEVSNCNEWAEVDGLIVPVQDPDRKNYDEEAFDWVD